MSVDVDDSEIKKTFKNIDAEIEDIEDDFDSLDIKSNVIKQIKDIIKEINNIGNKVEDIEIDIKADLDEADLMADLRNFKGEVDVKANVSGLGNFKDQEVDVNANVSGTSNIADMAQLGATSKLSSSMKGVSASVKEVTETMKKMFDTGVKNSVEYQTALERVRQAYTQIKDIQLEIGTGPDAQADWAEEFASGETIQNITKTLEAARKQFELFDQSMKIPQAKSCLQLIEELQEALFSIETKEIDVEFLDTLMKKMDALNEMSNIEVDIDANVKEAIDEAIKLGDLAKELAAKKYELRFNVNAEIDNLQDMIDDALSGNPYADIDMSEIGAAQEELEQLRQRQAALNNEIQNLCSKIDIATNNFNNLDYVLRQTGNNTNGAKNAFTVLGNALAVIKQKIAEIVPETSLLGTKFQVLKIYIDSFASKATQQLDKFKKKMAEITPEPIKKAFDKVKSAVSGLPPLLAKAGTGFVNLGKKMAQTKVIASGLNKVMGVFKTTLGKFGLMFGTYELIQFGKQAIATASSIEEAQNVIDVTFQKQSNTINKWAKENASAFGLTELQAKNFAGTFGTIFQAAGVSMDYADDMSMKLAQLAGDLASFRNLSVEDAFEKLRSGIVGSTEPLQNLGYNMSVAAMDAYLMSQGINVAFSDLSEASKQVVRFNYIMQQTKSIQGDYANTMNSFANSVRNLKNAFAVFSSEVGQTLIAALTPVIRVIATVIQWLTALARVFNSVLRGFGLIKGEAASAGAALGGVVPAGGGGGGIGGLGDTGAIEDTSGAIGGIGDAAEDSAGSVEKLKKEVKGLMGIDEINKLPAPEENNADSGSGGKGGSGGSGGIGGGAGVGAVDVPLDLGLVPNIDDSYTGAIEDKIEEMMEKIRAYLATFDWEPLKESFMLMYESVKPIIEKVGKVIKWLWDEILDPLIHFTIEDVLPRFFESLAYILDILNPILEVVLDNFKVLWDEVLEPIAKWTGDKFLDFWDWLNKHLKNFGDYLNENKTAAKILGDIATALILMWGGSKVVKGGSKVVGAIQEVIKWVHHLFKFITGSGIAKAIGSLFKGIGPAFGKAWGVIKVAFGKIGPALSKVWGLIKVLFGKIGPAFSKVWGVIKIAFGKIGPALSKVWGVIKLLFGKIGPLFTKLWGVIKAIGTAIMAGITTLAAALHIPVAALVAIIAAIAAVVAVVIIYWDEICAFCKKTWDKFTKWFSKTCKSIGKWFKELWQDIKSVWNKVADWFTDLFKKAWAGIKKAWSGVKKWFSDLWNGIKHIWKEVTSWFTNLFKSAWEGIKKAWSTVKKWFTDLWNGIKNVWKEVTSWFTNLFKSAWEGIKNAWSTVKKWFTDLWNGIKNVWKEATQWFTNLFKSAWDGIKNAWSTVKQWFTDLWNGIKNVWKEATQWFTNLFKSAWDGIKNAWSTVKQWFTDLWTGIKNVWKEATQWFTNLFASAWTGIKNAWSSVRQWFSDLWTSIKNVWKEVTQWFTNLFASAWTGIKNAWSGVTSWFSGIWTSIKNTFSNVGSWFSNIFTSAWNGIKSAWSGVTSWFSGIWTGIKNAFSGVGSWFSNIFASARDGIKNTWSSIKGFLTSPIESAKTAISNIISKMKGLFNFNWSLPRIKLPHFSITPYGWEFGDLLKGVIPKLGIEWYANGGIMTDPTAFGMNGNNLMVGGEAGAEAIVPLNTLWEQMDKFANKIVAGTRNGNDNRPIDIRNELYLDGNKVADSVIKNINRQTKLNGRSPLK